MNRYIYALVMLCTLSLSGCSLPANTNTAAPEQLLDEPGKKVQKLQDIEEQIQDNDSGAANNADLYKKSDTETDSKNVGRIHVTLYYQDGEGIIIPVTREFDSRLGIARTAVNALIDNSITREELAYFGVYPVLPMGTEVVGLDLKQGTATIDFNDRILDYKTAYNEHNIVSSVVYTLTEFETIENVRILVKGNVQQKLKYGTDISKPLNRQNLCINSAKSNLQGSRIKLDIYLFRNIKEYSFLLPVSVECESMDEGNIPQKIIELTDDIYLDGKVQSHLPEGTRIIDSNVYGGTLVLNFNNAFRMYGGNSREDAIIKQLQFSMRAIEGIDRIKILVEGEENTMPEGTEMSEGIRIPENINLLDES